jgi:hypothetical protein
VCLVGRPSRENPTSAEFCVFVSPVSFSRPCPPRTKIPPQPCRVVKLKTSFSSRPSSPRPENYPARPARRPRSTGVERPRSHSPPHLVLYRPRERHPQLATLLPPPRPWPAGAPRAAKTFAGGGSLHRQASSRRQTSSSCKSPRAASRMTSRAPPRLDRLLSSGPAPPAHHRTK